MPHADVSRMLEYEAKALLERLAEIRPFALTLPMVAAAAPSAAAQAAIESFLSRGRQQLRRTLRQFLDWLASPAGVAAAPERAQQRFTMLRMRFLSVITQFDVFADALAERSQHNYGELLGGLDVAAAEALDLPGDRFTPPPVICHLDRGAGAAIRRVRTRLEGGGTTPVAIIRVPRERMVGSGIASSLVHEVGHQAAELLDLVRPLRDALGEIAARGGPASPAWACLQAWISEILSDLWGVARVGIAATTGLIGVVSLPRVFVTRVTLGDPHPSPWIRVKISAAFGKALFPDPQWDRIASLWESLYPLDAPGGAASGTAGGVSPTGGTPAGEVALLRLLDATLPQFVQFVLRFRPERMGGATLAEAFPLHDRTPARLRVLWQEHRRRPARLAALPPTVAFAAVGQARHDGAVSATSESLLLRRLLRYWALRSTVDASEICSSVRRPRGLALAV